MSSNQITVGLLAMMAFYLPPHPNHLPRIEPAIALYRVDN